MLLGDVKQLTVEDLIRPITQAEGTTAGGNPSVSLRSTAPLTQGSQNAQTDFPTAAVTQEAQAQATETENRFPRAELYNMRSGKNGWDKAYGTAMEALNDAVQYVDPWLWDAIKSEGGDSNENIKYGSFPMVEALVAVQEEVRGEQITPMQGAKLLSEIYQQGGAEALKTIYNPRTGNLYDKYIGQAKQYVFQKATEAAQNVRENEARAETPPTTQNASQAASGELNRQAETNAQGQTGAAKKIAAQEGAENKNNNGETVRVVERLKEKIPEISDMNPVAKTSSDAVISYNGQTMAEKARVLFEKIKGTVTRQNFGDVEINGRSAKDDLSHGIGVAKAAVIPAIPQVIQSGRQIDFQSEWKGRPYDGYVFAAPVVLDGRTTYVAAVVKKTSKNRFYLHEVVDSDGNIINE